MITLADVARSAQVSKATASRVFSRPEAVSGPTAQRVLEAAELLGFVPNIAARRLAQGRIGMIGLLVPTLENDYYTPVISGAQQTLGELDLQLMVAVQSFTTDADLRTFERLARQADGFILMSPRGHDERLRSAAAFSPLVTVDRAVDGIDGAVADTPSAFGSVTSRLISTGHRRIAYLSSTGGSWQDPRRWAAVQSASRELTDGALKLGPYPPTFAAGIAAASDVMDSGADAVIPFATALGLGVRHQFSIDKVPHMPTVTTESAVAKALKEPNLPTIDVDGRALGRTAAEMLLKRIAAPNAPTELCQLPVHTGPE